jgi:hypothetical protein
MCRCSLPFQLIVGHCCELPGVQSIPIGRLTGAVKRIQRVKPSSKCTFKSHDPSILANQDLADRVGCSSSDPSPVSESSGEQWGNKNAMTRRFMRFHVLTSDCRDQSGEVNDVYLYTLSRDRASARNKLIPTLLVTTSMRHNMAMFPRCLFPVAFCCALACCFSSPCIVLSEST